jgi:citrate lyase subunit beta/citryl-CoA lyase
MGTDPHVRVWAMMETPLAMLNVGDVAAAALDSETRLAGFVMGTNDLAKDTRARLVPGRAPMVPWLMNCVAAARAYGLDILDGVYNDIDNVEGFAQECRQARDLGFDGKTLIHPRQIEPCNQAFSPTADELEAARKIIAAFDLPENENKAVIQVDGRMVERLHAEMARRTVIIADAIAKSKQRQPAASVA